MKTYTVVGQNIYMSIDGNPRELLAVAVTCQDAALIAAQLTTLENFLNNQL